MESLFDEDWSLWGPLGEASLPWTEGAPLDIGWLSKLGEGQADGTKPQHIEDLWEPLIDLVGDADFEDWMEIKMECGEELNSFSLMPECVDPFPPAVAPSSPEGELLGRRIEPEEAVVPSANSPPPTITTDDVTTSTSEAAILFSAMLEKMTSSSSIASPTSSLSNAPSSPERPFSRDSSFSIDSSVDLSSSSPPPSVEFSESQSHFITIINSEPNLSLTADESSPESTTSKVGRSSTSRKSPRASSTRPKSVRKKTVEIKVRKRDQNRDAATRYREKKRAENDALRLKQDVLEKKNHELRDRVDGLSAEIKYLKNLMKELLVARQK